MVCFSILSCSDKSPDMCLDSQSAKTTKKFDPDTSLLNKELEILDAHSIESKKALLFRYKKLAENNIPDAKYLLFFTYDLYIELKSCEIVEKCFIKKSDVNYEHNCNKKLVELRDYWIKEAIDQNHPKALMAMAHLQGVRKNDINLEIGNLRELDPEILSWIKRAAKAGDQEALGILEFINKKVQ